LPEARRRLRGSEHRRHEHHVEDAAYQEVPVLYVLLALEPRIDEPSGEQGQDRAEEAQAVEIPRGEEYAYGGRRLRMMPILGEYTRECLTIEVERSITARTW
jgi:hypothetical protein